MKINYKRAALSVLGALALIAFCIGVAKGLIAIEGAYGKNAATAVFFTPITVLIAIGIYGLLAIKEDDY